MALLNRDRSKFDRDLSLPQHLIWTCMFVRARDSPSFGRQNEGLDYGGRISIHMILALRDDQ